MKNITLKIDDEVYSKARIKAAKLGTSVSAMVREFLLVQTRDDTEKEAKRVAAMEEMYRIADARATYRTWELEPLTREECNARHLP